MKKQTHSAVITHLLRGAFLITLLLLVAYVPRAIGERISKEALKSQITKAAIAKESAKADVPLSKQPTAVPSVPTVCTLNGVLGTAPVGGETGTATARLFRPATAPSTCAAPTSWPTSIGGSFVYNAHYITNNTAATLCTN